jgi:hypothetical protein
LCSSRTPVASVVLVETASCPSRMPVATMAMDETASCPSPMPVATLAMDETASCSSPIPVATLATDEAAQAVAPPRIPSVAIAGAEHLPSDIPVPSESAAPVPLLSGIIARSNFYFSCGSEDLHAPACRDWLVGRSVARGCDAGRSSWVPVATMAMDETASCPSPMPVATLATDEAAQAVAPPRIPFVAIAGAEHLPSDIPAPSESAAPVPLLSGIIARSNFYFSCGSEDLHAPACRDWLVGRSVARGCDAGRSSW